MVVQCDLALPCGAAVFQNPDQAEHPRLSIITPECISSTIVLGST
jgi:hypothetical protein